MRGAIFLLILALAMPAAAQRYLPGPGPGVALEQVLPPAPKTGSVEDEADRATFRATRALAGSARWQQAIGDANETIPAMLADFATAAGRPLSPTATPALVRLLTRMRVDVAAGVNAVKPVYARRRPFLVDAGPVCQPRAVLANSFDYPSGHTSWGTAVAIVLAELVPGRATEILARGRDYGDSRVICGAHNASAVAAGRLAGAAMVARLHGDIGFRTDLDAARRELDPALAVMARIADPNAGPIVIAHRGCHAKAPLLGLGSAPENSLAALAQCVAIGVDVMETDVRMTRDGYLLMIHDATVDRTTDGHGRVADLTLAEIKALHLREDLGGPSARLTDAHVPTLAEMLDAAAGHVVLNLDIKDAVYAETIAAVLETGAQDRILVKATAGIGSSPLAALPPFERVPFIPMLSGSGDLPQVIARQAYSRIRPLGYEIPRMPLILLEPTVTAARAAHGRLWANTLWDGFVEGIGGDEDALRDPDRVWRRLVRAGVLTLQTDHPSELKRFVAALPSMSPVTAAAVDPAGMPRRSARPSVR